MRIDGIGSRTAGIDDELLDRRAAAADALQAWLAAGVASLGHLFPTPHGALRDRLAVVLRARQVAGGPGRPSFELVEATAAHTDGERTRFDVAGAERWDAVTMAWEHVREAAATMGGGIVPPCLVVDFGAETLAAWWPERSEDAAPAVVLSLRPYREVIADALGLEEADEYVQDWIADALWKGGVQAPPRRALASAALKWTMTRYRLAPPAAPPACVG